MRILLILLFLLTSINAFAGKQNPIRYSESADVFEVLDQLSYWRTTVDPSYEKYWKEQFGFTREDRILLEDYAKLRRKINKSEPKSKVKDGIFNPVDFYAYDTFAQAFYDASSIDEALKKVSIKLKNEELKFLVDFYRHFKKNLSTLIKESVSLGPKVLKYNREFFRGKNKTIIKRMFLFFNLDKKATINVLFVWAPPEEPIKLDILGNNIIVRMNPITHGELPSEEKVMYEIARAIISFQGDIQITNLTNQFKSVCEPPKGLAGEQLFHNPLALAFGKILPEDIHEKKKFNLYQEWSKDPWENHYSKVLFPLVKSTLDKKESVSESFIPNAAKLCKEILLLSDSIERLTPQSVN